MNSKSKKRQQFTRLQETLLKRRDALRRSLAGELQHLYKPDSTGVGDSVDAAVDGDYSEINSQLAQTESRELMRIEYALERIRQGNYGTCEVCGGKIAAVRLQALPYATMCIECQQAVERDSRLATSGRSWAEMSASSEEEPSGGADTLPFDRLDAVA